MTTPKQALEFYADPANWTDTPSWDGDPDNTTPKAIPILRSEEGHPCDCGDTARKALAALDASVSGAWRYDIKYGPEGEANYAWVYDSDGEMVCTAKTHHAEAIVSRMNTTASLQGEDAVRADSTANLITIIADIREKTGLGGKPMLNELAEAIVAEMDRRATDEREKMLDKVCENLIVLSRGDESTLGIARVALNNAAVFICGADRAKRAIRSGGGE